MPKTSTRRACLSLALLLVCAQVLAATPSIPAPQDLPYIGTIGLQVDASDLDHRIFHVRQQIPVKPGPMTLLFPRWLPGAHGPMGRVDRLAGLKLRGANQQALAWVRDPDDAHAFHLTLPSGTSQLDVEFQYLTPMRREDGRVVMTREMLNLQWNNVLLYPAGHHSSAIQIQTQLTLPHGWQQASALPLKQATDGRFEFQAVSLETLVDSPVFAGKHMTRIPLDPPGAARPVTLNVMADEAEQLQASEEQIQAHRSLVQQADKLFGARHFARYNFLLSLSDRMSGIGLEHHESSENGVSPSYFKNWAQRAGARELLPHEYVHSWNGKFRRPADLWTPNFNVPMRNSLLWLYEGQTQFWGRVLAARAGLVSAAQARDRWAHVAASLEHRAGRTWRNLQDTTHEALMGGRTQAKDWPNWQRGSDYYEEAALVWLEADSLIRDMSGGTKSLDDFARAFFGMEDGRVTPLTYTFDDVIATLNQVQAHDWRGFLRARLDRHEAHAPLGGLERAGWRLSFADTPSDFAKADDREDRADDFAYSLGLFISRSGKVEAVLWDGPAFRAGLNTAVTVIAVNGRAYKANGLSEAIKNNTAGKAPLQLLLKEGDFYRTVTLDYRGGLRYPRLERIPAVAERLDSGLLAPRQ